MRSIFLLSSVRCFYRTTTRRLHHEVRNSEPTLERPRIHRDILNIFECDRGLANHPNTSSNAKALVRKHVPRRVISQMNCDIRNDIRKNNDNKGERRKPKSNLRKINGEDQ